MQALEIMRPIRSLRHRFPNPNPNPRPLLRLSSWSVATTYDPVAGRFVTKRTQLPPNLPLATDSTTIYGDVKGTPVPDDEIGTRRYGDVMGTTSPIPTPSRVPADEIGTRRYGDVMETNSDEIGTRRYGDFIGRNTSNSTPYADGRRHNFASHQPSNSRQRELRWTGPAQTPEKYSAVVDRTRNGSRMYEDGAGSTTSNSKPYMEAAYKPKKTSFIADQNAGSRRTYEYANETASSSSNSQHFTDATGKMEKMSTIDDQSCGRRMHGYVTGMSSTSSSNSKPHTDATSKLEKSSTIDDQSSGRRRHNYVTGMSSSSSCSNSKPHTDAADTLEKTSMVTDQSRIRSSSSNSGPYVYASDKLEKTCIVDQISGISSIMDEDVIGTSSSNSNPYPDVADTPEKTSVVTDQTSCSYISSGVYGDMMGTSSSDSEPDPIDTDKPEKRSVVADQSSAGSRICSDLIGTGSSSSSSSSSSRKSKPEPIAADKPSKPLKAINTSVVDESSDSSWEDIDVTTRYNNKQKKGKSKGLYVCRNCGYTDGQWWGTCRECGEVGKMMSNESSYMSRVKVSDNAVRSWFPKNAAAATPIKLSEVRSQISHINWRIPLTGPFGTEVARVLGGGLVPGSLVLVGGDPGVGKSTMLLQIAAVIAQANDVNGQARVMYVSGEESVEQIGNRADRLNIQTDELYLHSSTDVEEILEQAQHLSPKALVIDSIQTVYLSGVTGSAGGVSQLKECTSALLRFAKKTNIAVFLIGHVTKSGEIAGPRVFEHIVDVVLYMEGEKLSSHRLLRSVKNRFGSTDELGVFEMSNSGLQAVSNPIGMFLGEQFSKSDYLAGLAVAVILDGSRAFLIEVQALCVVGSSSLRHVNGVQNSRADMIISVLTKQAAVKLQENGIFINVISGTNLTERAGDLAIAAAICSSYMERPVPNDTAFIAEIGLGGELRMVPQLEKRVKALAKLGFRRCIVPKSAEKSFAEMYESQENLEIVGCLDLKEMINIVF